MKMESDDMSKWKWDWKPSKFQKMRLDKDKRRDFLGPRQSYPSFGQQQNQANLLGQFAGLAAIGILGARK